MSRTFLEELGGEVVVQAALVRKIEASLDATEESLDRLAAEQRLLRALIRAFDEYRAREVRMRGGL